MTGKGTKVCHKFLFYYSSITSVQLMGTPTNSSINPKNTKAYTFINALQIFNLITD